MVVVEEGFAPLPSQRECLLLEPCKRILEDVGRSPSRRTSPAYSYPMPPPLVKEFDTIAILEFALHYEAYLLGLEAPYPILLCILDDILDELILIYLDHLI